MTTPKRNATTATRTTSHYGCLEPGHPRYAILGHGKSLLVAVVRGHVRCHFESTLSHYEVLFICDAVIPFFVS